MAQPPPGRPLVLDDLQGLARVTKSYFEEAAVDKDQNYLSPEEENLAVYNSFKKIMQRIKRRIGDQEYF